MHEQGRGSQGSRPRGWRMATGVVVAWLVVCAGPLAAARGIDPQPGGVEALHIRVDFPDAPGHDVSEAVARQSFEQAGAHLEASTWGELWFSDVHVTPVYQMPRSTDYYTGNFLALMEDAVDAANSDGYFVRSYWNHGVSFNELGYSWGGLGWIGSPGIWLNGTGDVPGLVTHEFGHNLGAQHAGFWDGASTDPLSPGGQYSQYGDVFDVMGRSVTEFDRNQFSTVWKARFGWLDDETNVLADPEPGVHRIYAHDAYGLTGATHVEDRPYALKLDTGAGTAYWLELRQAFADAADDAALQFRLSPGWGGYVGPVDGGRHNTDTLLLDMTGQGEAHTAPLPLGGTYTSDALGLHVTPLAAGYADDGNLWLDVGLVELVLGDMNGDGVVNTADVAPFVLALTDPQAYDAAYGLDPVLVGDINQDGAFNTADVAPFVELLTAAAVPEPGTLALLGAATMMLAARRRGRIARRRG